MSDALRPLRVNAVELLRQTGAIHTIDATFAPATLDVAHDRLAGDVVVDLRLESSADAIAVSGTVSAPWAGPCRRCLRDLAGVATAGIDERYQAESTDAVTDDDTWPIDGGQLDLVPMVRQTVLLQLDDERLCGDDCAGLCPVCGIDRNEATCDCVVEVRDERWAALDGLVVDE